jgi:putative transposase
MGAIQIIRPATAPAPVPHYRFDPTDRLTIGKRSYVWKETSTQGHLLERVDEPNLTEAFSHDQIATLLHAGALIRDERYFAAATQLAMSHAEITCLAVLTDDEQSEIVRRAEYVRRFLRLEEDWRGHRALRRARRLALGEPPRRVTRSDKVMKTIIKLVNDEMRQIDYAAALARIRTKEATKRFGINAKVHKSISARTLRRWLTTYETALAQDGATRATALLMLRPLYRNCGNRAPRYDFECYAFIRKHAVAYASRERPSVETCYRAMERDIGAFNASRRSRDLPEIALPSKTLLGKHIKSLDKFWVCVQRFSLEKARAKFASIGQGPDAERPLQRVEMDGWEVHLKTLLIGAGVYGRLTAKQREAVDKVRMVLSVVIDCATRCILAMRLTRTEDALAGVSALAMAMSDKSALAAAAGALTTWHMGGTPGSLFVDNGYAANILRESAIHSIIHVSVVPAALPWLRPYIERLFRTFDLQLMPLFSGRTFANVVEAEGYDSDKLASLTAEELADGFVRYAVDVYHLLPHEGLHGETPYDAWQRMTRETPPLPPPDKAKFAAVFGVRHRATLGRHGLRALCITYQSDELQELFRRGGATDVEFKIHPEDAAFAVVMINGGWRRLTPTDDGYEGVPVADLMAAMTRHRQQNDDKAATHRPTVLETLNELRGLGASARQRAGISEVPHTEAEIAHATRMFTQTLHVSAPAEETLLAPTKENEADPLAGGFEVGDADVTPAPETAQKRRRRKKKPGASPPAIATRHAGRPTGETQASTAGLNRHMGPLKRKERPPEERS